MNFFGRPRNAAPQQQQQRSATPDVAQSILRLRGTVDTLEKRESHIQKKVEQQVKEARDLAKKDRNAALYRLKRKKMYEGEITKIRNAKMTLEQQMMSLESQATTMETYRAMQEGTRAMQAARQNVDAEQVAETMDDIRDEMEEANQISDAIGQPLDQTLEDDEALLEELNELEQLELEETLLNTPSVPADRPVVSLSELPEAPTTSVVAEADEDEAALRELEAAMAM